MYEELKRNNRQKIDEFAKELEMISSIRIRTVVEIALCFVAPAFFEVETTSSGKYHPLYAHGRRGLLRHTRAAVNIAYELMESEVFNLSQEDKDIAIAALILHDTCKRGVKFEANNTLHTHPVLLPQLIPDGTFYSTDNEVWKSICDVVSTHMGKWTTSQHDAAVLPKPQTELQKFVSMADYLASRKMFEVMNIWNKEDEEIIEALKKEPPAAKEPMTDAQKKFIMSLCTEYIDSCKKLNIAVDKKYTSDNISFLNKKTAGGFIGKLKKQIQKNKELIAQKA